MSFVPVIMAICTRLWSKLHRILFLLFLRREHKERQVLRNLRAQIFETAKPFRCLMCIFAKQRTYIAVLQILSRLPTAHSSIL
jgi:hypothetical protein